MAAGSERMDLANEQSQAEIPLTLSPVRAARLKIFMVK